MSSSPYNAAPCRVIPCQNKEKKGQRQKITFFLRNMKEYRVLIWFLLFLASIWFLGPFWKSRKSRIGGKSQTKLPYA